MFTRWKRRPAAVSPSTLTPALLHVDNMLLDTTVKHKLLMCLLCTIAQSLNWTHSQTHTHTHTLTRSILSPRGSIRTFLFLMWILLYGLHLGVYRVQRELCPYGNSMSHTHTQTNAGAHIHTQNFPSNGIALILPSSHFSRGCFPPGLVQQQAGEVEEASGSQPADGV